MAGQVGEIPGYGSVTLSKQLGAIDQRDIVELGAPDALRLNEPEQACVVQITLGFRRISPSL